MREHLDVDAALVHFLEAQCAKIVQPLVGIVAAAGLRPGVVLGQLGIPIMLFDRDDRAIRLFKHGVFPRAFIMPVPSNAEVPCHGHRLPWTRPACARRHIQIRMEIVVAFASRPTQLITAHASDSPHDLGGRRSARRCDPGDGAQAAADRAGALADDFGAGARRLDRPGRSPGMATIPQAGGVQRADEIQKLRALPDTPVKSDNAKPATTFIGFPLDRNDAEPDDATGTIPAPAGSTLPVEIGEPSSTELPVAKREETPPAVTPALLNQRHESRTHHRRRAAKKPKPEAENSLARDDGYMARANMASPP